MDDANVVEEPHKAPYTECFDEACTVKPSVRMSVNGEYVYLCGQHARLLVSAR